MKAHSCTRVALIHRHRADVRPIEGSSAIEDVLDRTKKPLGSRFDPIIEGLRVTFDVSKTTPRTLSKTI
ncbi:MAG: hypothetical protein ACXV2D_09725 [Halobacteriota archaeon]